MNLSYNQFILCKLTYRDEINFKIIYKYVQKSENGNFVLSSSIQDRFFKEQFIENQIIFKEIDHYMGIKARNPRANLVDAHYLHSMAQLHQKKKKSKMNI